MKNILSLILLLCFFSCTSKDQSYFHLVNNESKIDSLIISDIISEEIIEAIQVKEGETKHIFSEDSLRIGVLRTLDDRVSKLIMLGPNTQSKLEINSDSSIYSNSIADSLLNYLTTSNNVFLRQNMGFIASTSHLDSIVIIAKEFQKERGLLINNHAESLTRDEQELLHFQNEARINSFLLYFGRLNKKIDIEHSYFDFTKNIDTNTAWAKSLPINILYKLEIDYLIQNDSLTDINRFIQFMDTEITNRDLFSFMKAYYLKEIIEAPSYWETHYQLFNTTVLQQVLEAERNNPYYHLIEGPSENYFSSSAGEIAYDFTAIDVNGSEKRLSDYKGKIVFIDTWATWCGACLIQKPRAMAIAKQYEDEPNVEVLFISVNSSEKRWLNYLEKNNELDYPNHLLIKNGLRTEFGDRYNIKLIPRYILIDAEGKIINGNMTEPSKAVYDLIERALKNI